jgi:hypothetical protein
VGVATGALALIADAFYILSASIGYVVLYLVSDTPDLVSDKQKAWAPFLRVVNDPAFGLVAFPYVTSVTNVTAF